MSSGCSAGAVSARAGGEIFVARRRPGSDRRRCKQQQATSAAPTQRPDYRELGAEAFASRCDAIETGSVCRLGGQQRGKECRRREVNGEPGLT